MLGSDPEEITGCLCGKDGAEWLINNVTGGVHCVSTSLCVCVCVDVIFTTG